MTEVAPTFEAAISFAADLIRIPSPPGGEGEAAARVVAHFARLGFDESWNDDVGNAIGLIRGRGEAPAVVLSSHLDVVDAGDPSAWEHPPYGGVVDDGYLHGRGAMDIKGPLALQTYAAAAFLRDRPPGDLLVAHTVFEERGGWGMARFMETDAGRAGAVIIGEATGGDICIGHRGRAEVLIEIRGRAGHASEPRGALNALDGVPAVLEALRSMPDAALAMEDPVLGRSTLVATDVFASPASRNVIPDTATVVVDWRVLPGMGRDGCLELLRSHLSAEARLPEGLTIDVRFVVESQRSWTGLETDWEMFGRGFLVASDHPVPSAAAAAVESVTGRRPAIRPWRFATDGRHTCGEHGIPTIGFAPGEEGHAHTNSERLSLAAAREVFEAYPALIRAVFEALV